MPTYNVLEAKTNLSKLIDDVESGREKEVIIARNGKPAVRITTLEPSRRPVRLGLAEGKYSIPDDWDELNPVIQQMFDDSKIDWL